MSTSTPRLKVAIIYGGRSSEHSVSCVTAGSMMDHLDPERFEVIPVGITTQGVWTVGTTCTEELKIKDGVLPEVTETEEIALSVNPARKGEFRYIAGERSGEVYATADVMLPALHGKFGEDGTIQGLFELSGVPYVGTGVLSSACGMDKEFTKKLLAAEGLPIGREIVLPQRRELTAAERDYLGLPVFVKPARGGSSIGISKVTAWEDLPDAIELALRHDPKVIIEAEIVGAEVECGVLQKADGSIVASLPAQLADTDAGEEGFYGFDAKYLHNVVDVQLPAPLSQETTREVQRYAIEAFKALNCSGLSRVDFFVTPNGPVINEVNTMPGFTPISMYPVVMEATGIGYADLLAELIAQALATAEK